jgi:hypothetical protein
VFAPRADKISLDSPFKKGEKLLPFLKAARHEPFDPERTTEGLVADRLRYLIDFSNRKRLRLRNL